MALHIVPDYIVYDELKKERRRQARQERPRLNVPRYMPIWSDHQEEPEEDNAPQESERGEVIISMF